MPARTPRGAYVRAVSACLLQRVLAEAHWNDQAMAAYRQTYLAPRLNDGRPGRDQAEEVLHDALAAFFTLPRA